MPRQQQGHPSNRRQVTSVKKQKRMQFAFQFIDVAAAAAKRLLRQQDGMLQQQQRSVWIFQFFAGRMREISLLCRRYTKLKKGYFLHDFGRALRGLHYYGFLVKI